MNNLNWPPSNPDLVCECSHQLRWHSLRCYQDMQTITSLTGYANMIPVGAAYEVWKCEDCSCDKMRVSNLRYLEQKYNESKSTI